MYIAGVPRVAVVAALLLLGLYLFVRSAAIRTILLAFLLGGLQIPGAACFAPHPG